MGTRHIQDRYRFCSVETILATPIQSNYTHWSGVALAIATAIAQWERAISKSNTQGSCCSCLTIPFFFQFHSLVMDVTSVIHRYYTFYFYRKLKGFSRIITINVSFAMVMMNMVFIIFFTLEHTQVRYFPDHLTFTQK